LARDVLAAASEKPGFSRGILAPASGVGDFLRFNCQIPDQVFDFLRELQNRRCGGHFVGL
jgi:hypothetical protein